MPGSYRHIKEYEKSNYDFCFDNIFVILYN